MRLLLPLIDPRTFNIDPGGIEHVLTGGTKAIIAVHLYGQTAPMNEIMSLAGSRDIAVIEDACQAIGASHRGCKAGSMGNCGCFSFFPSKNLGGYGDGGMVVTGDRELARKVRALHLHGIYEKYRHHSVGINSRLDAIQAAVLLVKMKYLDKWNMERAENAEYYNSRLKDVDDIAVPFCEPDNSCVYNQYVVRSGRRDELKVFLDRRGVGNEIYYPLPLHLQKCFSSLGFGKGDFPQAERAARETLAIPVYPELSREEQDYVIGTIKEFIQQQ
jgi:dTDP-4-amino-4,6-dideoxygalactose transaminase